MSATQAIVRLDLLTVRPYRKQLLVLVAVGLAITISTPDPSVALPAAAVYAALAAAYPFAIGDKADLATLLGALPVRRSAVVLGRYAFATLTFLGAAAIATIAMVAVAAARSIPLEPATTAVLLASSFAIFALTVGIQFPMYFAMGYTRARMLSYLPFAAIVLIAVVGAPLLPQGGADLTPDTAVTIAITTAGLAILTISALVSRRVFGHRAL
jgi:ABC-type transport system involved in multi-copper enzyme maturation permease subunit